MDGEMDGETVEEFEAERPRLTALAARVLGDRVEAEDVVQRAWLRLYGTDADVMDLPAWLTTVTTRLCLDRLKARTPVLVEEVDDVPDTALDPADESALADTVGIALQVVLDRLPPRERVAFVLHDSFGFAFPTIAAVLDTTPAAARKLASRARARARIAQPAAEDRLADWVVVDAFMAAARGGDLARLLELLAPDAGVTADAAALQAGTPGRIEGREAIAAFFDGSAHAALPVLVGDRPGYAWYHRGEAKVVFDFAVAEGQITGIVFRAEPAALAEVARRSVTPAAPPSSQEQSTPTTTEDHR